MEHEDDKETMYTHDRMEPTTSLQLSIPSCYCKTRNIHLQLIFAISVDEAKSVKIKSIQFLLC